MLCAHVFYRGTLLNAAASVRTYAASHGIVVAAHNGTGRSTSIPPVCVHSFHCVYHEFMICSYEIRNSSDIKFIVWPRGRELIHGRARLKKFVHNPSSSARIHDYERTSTVKHSPLLTSLICDSGRSLFLLHGPSPKRAWYLLQRRRRPSEFKASTGESATTATRMPFEFSCALAVV